MYKWLSVQRVGVTALALATLSGCHTKAPSGQVVATMGDIEITRSQLDAELQAQNIAPNQRAKAEPAVLQSLIDRALFVQAAEKQKLQQTPAVVINMDRARSMILEKAYLDRSLTSLRTPPSQVDIERYVSNHPEIADDRAMLSGSQIRFAMTDDPAFKTAIERTMTMPELVQLLRSRDLPVEEAPLTLDTATVPSPMLVQIRNARPGEPIVAVNAGEAAAISINGRTAKIASPAETNSIASQRIVNERLLKAVEDRRLALRSAVKISYAKGMSPAKVAGK